MYNRKAGLYESDSTHGNNEIQLYDTWNPIATSLVQDTLTGTVL